MFKDAQLAAHLTLLELPNLLTMLDMCSKEPRGRREGTIVVEPWLVQRGKAGRQPGPTQALAVATRVREQAAQNLGDWSHARFLAESSNIDRLLERGDLPAAHDAAQRLLDTASPPETPPIPKRPTTSRWRISGWGEC